MQQQQPNEPQLRLVRGVSTSTWSVSRPVYMCVCVRACVCVWGGLVLACGYCGNFWRLQLPRMCRYVTSYVAKAHTAKKRQT